MCCSNLPTTSDSVVDKFDTDDRCLTPPPPSPPCSFSSVKTEAGTTVKCLLILSQSEHFDHDGKAKDDLQQNYIRS